MGMLSPYAEFKNCVSKAVGEALARLGLDLRQPDVAALLLEPPRPEFGDFALPLPRVSKQLAERCEEVSSIMCDLWSECVERVDCAGSYLNVRLRNDFIVRSLARALSSCGSSYGIVRKGPAKKVVVEFVSANPVHPLHVGSGRNAALGDFVARAHELLGDVVERRYYVNDLGLQVAHLLYGYVKLSRPKAPPAMKDDHFLGLVYAATTILADILKLRKKLKESGEESSEILKELNSLIGDLMRIKAKTPELVDGLIKAFESVEDVEQEIRALAQAMEVGDPSVVEVHREVVSRVLEGIRQTLGRLGITFDKWDYESDLVRSGLVAEILERARSSGHFTYHKGAPALDLRTLAEDAKVREELAIPKSLEVPPLILARTDGTTLYTTRDIAYTIKKFRESGADKVYNVVAVEQTLPQAQLRLALRALGYLKESRSLVHYAYEMVNVKGFSMSGRRARYVTVDEVLDSLVARARELASSRGVDISDDVALKIARSAFKYIMLSVSPRKTLVFDPGQAVEVRSGTATYVQYTYARANSLLSKYGRELDFVNLSAEGLTGKRRELALMISRFPEIFSKVALELTPEDMVSYLNRLAEVFNSWYDEDPVLTEPSDELRNLKLLLVYGVKVVIENAFKLLGLDIVEKI